MATAETALRMAKINDIPFIRMSVFTSRAMLFKEPALAGSNNFKRELHY